MHPAFSHALRKFKRFFFIYEIWDRERLLASLPEKKISSPFDLFDHSLTWATITTLAWALMYILHLCCFDGAQRLLIGFLWLKIDRYVQWCLITLAEFYPQSEWSFLVWPIIFQNPHLMTNQKSHWIHWSWSFSFMFSTHVSSELVHV